MLAKHYFLITGLLSTDTKQKVRSGGHLRTEISEIVLSEKWDVKMRKDMRALEANNN